MLHELHAVLALNFILLSVVCDLCVKVSHWTAYEITVNSLISEIAKNNEDKFKKMKDIYGKLREEHVQLLRMVNCSAFLLITC